MSVCHATEYDIAAFSKNKYCTFYVVRDIDTDKHHVFVVVFPLQNLYDKKGYLISTHSTAESALHQKNRYVKKFKGVHVYD